MKKIFWHLFPVIMLLLLLLSTTAAAVTNPVLTVKVAGTQETVSGRAVLTVDWTVMANVTGLQLRGGSGLRLAYDNTVLQLIRFSGTGADYMLTETLSGVPAAARPGVYEGAIIDVRACRSVDSTIGYLTIELGHQEYIHDCAQSVEETLASIRFAFRDGKSQADLSGNSIRLMTIEELASRSQPAAVNIMVVSDNTNTEYVYRSRTITDTLNAPGIILPVPSDNVTGEPSGPANPNTPTAPITPVTPTIPPDLTTPPSGEINDGTFFTDIENAPAWAKDAINFVVARNLVVGLTGNLFNSSEYVTRGEFTATLMRAYGIELDPTATDNFDDVDRDAAYAPYIATAKKYSIVLGVGKNLFLPESQITREEMFTLLYRTLVNINEAPKASPSGKTLSDFKDADMVAGWSKEEIEALLQAGMIDGTGNNQLSPKRLTDRATMAQMIYNLLTR